MASSGGSGGSVGEGEERERAAREQGGAAVGGLGGLELAAQLVHPAEALPEVARLGIEVARRGEGGEGGVEVAAPEVQLAAAGERVLVTDGGRVAAAVERAALIERLGRALEVAEIAQPARKMEEHLHLHAAAALALLARRVLPDLARAAQGLDRVVRAVHLLEAVAAAEEAEVVGREGRERAVVPAQRLRPLLLALEVPADGEVELRHLAERVGAVAGDEGPAGGEHGRSGALRQRRPEARAEGIQPAQELGARHDRGGGHDRVRLGAGTLGQADAAAALEEGALEDARVPERVGDRLAALPDTLAQG